MGDDDGLLRPAGSHPDNDKLAFLAYIAVYASMEGGAHVRPHPSFTNVCRPSRRRAARTDSLKYLRAVWNGLKTRASSFQSFLNPASDVV